MPSEEDRDSFDSYKNSSTSLQRVFIIILGVGFFFFFAVLLPYYSLRLDSFNLLATYGSLNNTLDNIQNISQAYLDQYNRNIKQNVNLTQQLNKYYNQLTDKRTNQTTLDNITYTECDAAKARSKSWLDCNYFLKSRNLQATINATIMLNSTTIQKFDNAISRLDEMINKPDRILDVDQLTKIKESLIILKNSSKEQTFFTRLFDLQNDINKLAQAINVQISSVKAAIKNLIDRFTSVEAPVVGKLPIGFNEMVAIFPFALTITFFFFSMNLRDTIRLRKVLERSKDQHIAKYFKDTASWVDPSPNDATMLHRITSWITLLIPVALFLASLYILFSVWYQMPVKNDEFPMFIAAADFNLLIYTSLYIISIILLSLSYIMIVKEPR
jgi:hypothetical protein